MSDTIVTILSARRTKRNSDAIAPFTLRDSAGAAIESSTLLRDGPALFLFVNADDAADMQVTLPLHAQRLQPLLAEQGIVLIAVVQHQAEALALPGVTILSDQDDALVRQLGILRSPAATDVHPTLLLIEANHRISYCDNDPAGRIRSGATGIEHALRLRTINWAA